MTPRFFSQRLALSVLLLASAILIPALVRADPTDPFDPANKAPVLNDVSLKLIEIIQFEAAVSPPKAKRGEVVRVTITGKPAVGHYTYPATQHTGEQGKPTVHLSYGGIEGVRPLWPIEESSPQIVQSVDGKIVLEHLKPFTWTQELLIDPQAKPGSHEIAITINKLQVCNKGTCYGPAPYRPIYVPIEIEGGDAVAPARSLTDREKGPPPAKVVTPTADEIAKARAEAQKDPVVTPGNKDRIDANNLLSFLGFAMISAILMLLTPCVFPMIPITVNFFIKQSEKEHHNPLLMASVYSGTIIVLLTAVMLALGSVIISIANNEWFNIALGLVLIFFALSLFGMYEIELPSFLARYTSAHEGKGGLVGAIFMAMTFTITSFTCTGPFLGLMLGSVAGVKPPMMNLVLGALVYSTTFAAPFFVLALFPSFLKKLPKSGGWMNAVKVTMGFLELGAALKFLSNADFIFFPGNPQLFNYDTVLAAWIALSIACSLYLFGLYRLPHDDPSESIGVVRMLASVGFLTLAIYLAPGMFGLQPAGFVGDNVVAFLPIRTGHENDALGGKGGKDASGHKDWYLDYEDAWKDAIQNKKLIFIDFTGTQCSNCRYNENSVFPLPQVNDELKKFVKVSLYTDSVPNKKLTAAESSEQASRNQKWQKQFGSAALPLYIVFQPAADTAVNGEGELKGSVVEKTEGAIFDVAAFVRVLQGAQGKMTAQARLPAD